MKSKYILIVSSLLISGITMAAQASSLSCEGKKNELRTQIDYAKSYGNTHQVTGLEKALREVTEHCSDELLRQESQLKIQEKAHKVAERQRELEEIRQYGSQEKIDKKLKKLREAEEELAAAKNNAA